MFIYSYNTFPGAKGAFGPEFVHSCLTGLTSRLTCILSLTNRFATAADRPLSTVKG
jgi:hypothetical protein